MTMLVPGIRVKPSPRYLEQYRGKPPTGGVILRQHRNDPQLRIVKWDDRAMEVTIHQKFLVLE